MHAVAAKHESGTNITTSKQPTKAQPTWQVYGKKLKDGTVGALLLNRGTAPLDITVNFKDLWWTAGSAVVRDLWAEKDIGSFKGGYVAKAVPAHGTVALRLKLSSA